MNEPILAIRELVVTIGGSRLLDVDALDVGRLEVAGQIAGEFSESVHDRGKLRRGM